jgi:uncharacterized membrane protein YGL010W
MRRLDALFADYGASHSTRGNLRCHAAGITLIVFGLLCFLSRIPIAGIWTASELLLVVTFGFYAALDLPLALAVVVYATLLDLAARAADSWQLGLAAFVAGWVFQAVGHAVYEKNRPAFLRNLVHLLVGPAYLVAEALRLRKPSPRGFSTASRDRAPWR